MKRAILILIIAAVSVAVAQKPPKPPEAPKISDTLAKNYFKAHDKFLTVQQQYTAAQQELQKSIQDLVAACGAKYNLSATADGDPVCVAKPEPAKK